MILLSCIGFTLDSCIFNQEPQGKVLYDFHCSSCHMPDGQGLKSLYPPIAQSDYTQENASELACIIRNGIKDTITVNGKTYNNPMPGIPELNSVEIANIANYIMQELNDEKDFFLSPQTVEKQLNTCEK